MGLFTKREFADQCGINTKALAVYIKRGKVLAGDDGMIDTSTDRNADFLRKKSDVKQVKATPPVKAKPATRSEKKKADVADKEKKKQDSQLYELEKLKKALDMEKRENEINLQRIEIAKKQGELVPTSLIKSLIIQQSEAMRVHYNEATEGLISIYNSIQRLTPQQAADIKKKMDENVNKTIDKIVETSKRNLKNVALEYAKTRGVGQHD
jgi:hypothetical protein